MSGSLGVLVVTVVHHPLDTRILVRQIRALLDAGHEVTYAAPFAARGVTPPPGVEPIDLPRSSGRNRFAAIRAARRIIQSRGHSHDVVLIHDPELLLAIAGLNRITFVWDVHEDTAAAVRYKEWIPAPLQALAAGSVRQMESWAERRHHLTLAEASYADRFRGAHPIVPNSTVVVRDALRSAPGRAVCVSTLTRARGALDLIEAGRILRDRGIAIDVIGPAEAGMEGFLRAAHHRGDIRWHGHLPHAEAMLLAEGATAGLSLLHDERNYRQSQPTKVLEYMAYGIPVVVTPLPLTAQLVEGYRVGLVVPFADPRAIAEAVTALNSDRALRLAMGDRGREAVEERHNWTRDAPAFVATIEAAARSGTRARSSTAPPSPPPLRPPLR